MVAKASQTEGNTERHAIVADFKKAVNMTPAALEKWLGSEESKSVGMVREGEHEAVGHASGRKIVVLMRKRQADLTEDDLTHMQKVVSYVARHLAQGGPAEDAQTSRWRYSLMNWGHDPLETSR